MRNGLAILGLCAALSACASSPVTAPTQLVFFHPFRPGVLAPCENAHRRDSFAREALPDATDPLKAWVVQEAFELRWPGGRLAQAALPRDGAAPPRARTDVCFALFRHGQVVTSGAVVAEQSARLLTFPTLVRLNTPPDTPTRYELRPRFPGHPADAAPPAWSVLNTP